MAFVTLQLCVMVNQFIFSIGIVLKANIFFPGDITVTGVTIFFRHFSRVKMHIVFFVTANTAGGLGSQKSHVAWSHRLASALLSMALLTPHVGVLTLQRIACF
jgi:hypothetical protein